MLPSYLLTLREGLEAALIIGVALGALRKVGRQDLRSVVWLGTLVAIVISLVVGLSLNLAGASIEGKAEQIFEGFTMFLAAGVLTWMVFWMQRQASSASMKIEGEVMEATLGGGTSALFLLAFLAVLREGIELGLFLTAVVFTTGAQQVLIGAVLGLLTVVFLAWALFTSLVRLDLRLFFLVTGGLLIVFAAGLVAHGVHEFNEVGWIPPLIEHVWDINNVLDEKSTLGEILKALFGYNGNPSLTEVIAYLAYYAAIYVGLRGRDTNSHVQDASPGFQGSG